MGSIVTATTLPDNEGKTMKILIALSLLVWCPGLAQNISANLQVDEHGQLYNQTEVFDPKTGDIISHVPSHWRSGIHLHDVTIIKNENLGLAVWKLKDEDVCFLEDLDPEEHPARLVLEAAYLEAHNVTVHTEDIRTVNLRAVDDGDWEGDRNTLTEDMARLCEGLPIRKVHNVEMEEGMVRRRKRRGIST